MKNWDFARLTHDAAQAGGVEEYIAMIRRAGFSDGKRSMYPWIPAAIGVGWLLKITFDKAVDVCKGWEDERIKLKNNEELAKKELANICAPHPSCEGEETTHE